MFSLYSSYRILSSIASPIALGSTQQKSSKDKNISVYGFSQAEGLKKYIEPLSGEVYYSKDAFIDLTFPHRGSVSTLPFKRVPKEKGGKVLRKRERKK